jgi:hypothetical protein
MHASITKFNGDPAGLLARYDALLAGESLAGIRQHLCLRADDGIVIVDVCPTREAYDEFFGGGAFSAMLERYGLPEPVSLEDFPVHVSIVEGSRVTRAAAPAAG